MKTTIVILVMLILISTTHSQDWSQLPELPVWYELENTGTNITQYLPNFDTANGGINSAVNASKFTGTIYNRFKFDTLNQFMWSQYAYGNVTPVDFNGDGIKDYIDGNQYVYQTIERNKPPLKDPVAKYAAGINQHYIVADLDNDGNEDVLVPRTLAPSREHDHIGSLILGGKDLTKLQNFNIPHTPDSTECIIDAYTNNGKARMITLAVDESNKSAKLVLWEIRFITAGSKISVAYGKLHEIKVPYSIILNVYGTIAFHTTQHTLNRLGDVYNLDNDKIEKLFDQKLRPLNVIEYKIKNQKQQGWVVQGNPNDPDPNKVIGLLFRGNPRMDTTPIGRITLYNKYNDDAYLYAQGNIVGIGDINNDGNGDLAVYYRGIVNGHDTTRFVIHLGIDKSVGVTEQPQNTISFNLQSNNPIARTGKLQVTIKAHPHTSLTLMLYDMRGAQVAELWKGNSEGIEQQLALDISTYHLSTGMYNLRLQSGAQFTDKAIIIE